MSKETNIENFFTLPKSLQKSDVNRHARNNEDNKTTLLGCMHLNAIEKLTKQFADNFNLRTSKEKKG
jgi:hypothetical protein